MLSILSTREIALSIWLVIIFLLIILSNKMRPLFMNVIKTATSKTLLIPFLLILLCSGIITLIFIQFSIWKSIYLKDIIIWTLFSAVPMCFKTVSIKSDETYFKNILLENLKFTIIVEFIISSFTFKLLSEIIMLPILTFLFMLQAVAERKEEHKPVLKLISIILTISGVFLLFFTIRKIILEHGTTNYIDLLVSFLIPIILSLLYLPIVYLFALYTKYEIVFKRMHIKEPNKKLKGKRKLIILVTCNISYKKIREFNSFAPYIYKVMTNDEFNAMITAFKKNFYNEK